LMAAPNVNQAAKVIRNAKAGLVVSPDSPEEFVAAAKAFMNQPDERAAYAQYGRAYAERHFNIGFIADRFLNLIQA